jgi:hypothetical protein
MLKLEMLQLNHENVISISTHTEQEKQSAMFSSFIERCYYGFETFALFFLFNKRPLFGVGWRGCKNKFINRFVQKIFRQLRQSK